MLMTDDDGQMGAHIAQGRLPAYDLERVAAMSYSISILPFFLVTYGGLGGGELGSRTKKGSPNSL